MPSAAAADPFELLKRLTETPGVPGREERIRELVLAETEGLWDETRTDALGSLICLKRATRRDPARCRSDGEPLRVMLACHMDEIGFYVRYIDDSGFVRVQNVGGFDTRNLFARRVVVHGREDLPGVLNPTGKPIHLASEEDKKRIPQISDFYIDLFRPKAEIVKCVEVGDPVTLWQTTEVIGEAVCGKAMDNRVALWVGINAIRQVLGAPGQQSAGDGRSAARGRSRRSARAVASRQAGRAPARRPAAGPGSAYDIYFVASTQEEVGLRGATAAAYGIEPDIGIAVDTTLCCDTPGTSKEDVITEFGKGVAIKVMDGAAISHRGLFDEFIALAQRKRIAHQREILPRGGTDAGALQKARAGTRTITLSVPTRYIHTEVEAIHKRDAQAAVSLLAAWLGTR
jgi:putative aminopeptidase FrvX